MTLWLRRNVGSWLPGLVAALSVSFPGYAEEPSTVWVSCAMSLKPAVAQVSELFEEDHPGVHVQINAGGSGLLVQQARRGAPVDLFVSASPVEMDRLEREGLLREGSRRPISANRLVLVAPPDQQVPASLAELGQGRFDRIALGNPNTAPVGRYAMQALESHGLARELRNRLVFGENARQVCEYVARGEAAAGLVYRTDARLLGSRLTLGPEIPGDSHEPIRYEAAVMQESQAADLARQLLDALTSAEARAILKRHGFTEAR